MAEDVCHLNERVVCSVVIPLEECIDLTLVTNVCIASLLGDYCAQAADTTVLGDLVLALSHEIIKELVCLALAILGSKDPLKCRLLTVCISRHCEETLALGLTSALIEVLFDVQHVSLSIVLANVVSAH